MDNNTKEIIESLATKLGVTAEHLWGVLINQAPVSGLCDIILTASLTAFLLWVMNRLIKVDTDESKTFDEMGKAVSIGLVGCFLAFLLVSFYISFPVDIAGIMNPEYWALKQIIK